MTAAPSYERTLRLLLDAGVDYAEADAIAREPAEQQTEPFERDQAA